MPGWDSLPDTLRRSPKKAQRTWVKAHDSAIDSYGEGRRAHQVAYAALKHSYEKVGDHWEAKPERGPSDSRARRGASSSRGRSRSGVDANATKEHLYEVARKLDLPGRSKMSKSELVRAIERTNARETARARR
ncbi:ChaB family protein [Actinoalloteichus spitiensis]|uniref:ChaB family protein n=1 Tax=Actinoalloteichus spitiensis TaxID=252394 RepID=UPI00035E883C|nr:ChaB family protein [Actinoalloteichus spitiensis]